jgi:REP element-mobilizing transposase RayT
MSRKYKFHESSTCHFVSFATVHWIDVFTRRIYCEVMVESLDYCIKNKGLLLNAWCIMPNHIHLIIRSESNDLSNIMRDLKKYTSKELFRLIESEEMSRKQWMSWLFKRSGQQNGNNTHHQFWQQHNHPRVLNYSKKMYQKLDYLHMNPVKAGLVVEPEHWQYSSARNYAGLDSRLDLELIER